MRRPRRRNRPLLVALYLNAGLLAVVTLILVSRGGSNGGVTLAAGGPPMPQLAGGGALYLMPAQFSLNTWGCYVMDIDAQTICAYQYLPGGEGLKLVAARNFRFDRSLRRYNTSPNPDEIQRLIQMEQNPLRGKDNFPPATPDQPPTPGPATAPEFRGVEPVVPDPRLIAPDPKLMAPDSRPSAGEVQTPALDSKLVGRPPETRPLTKTE